MFRVLLLAIVVLLPNFPAFADEVAPVLSYAPIVKRVVPAVVNIYTRHTEKVQVSPLMSDPLFREFFGASGVGGMPRERVVQSLGSGVIVDPTGVIVTSYHVVKGSDAISVVLSDRREFEGHVAKVDEGADIAILKVDTKGAALPTLALRDSDTLEVGDLVLAVGNPFGVGTTVTSGIISALARSAASVSDYQFFIQTDAAINPGNSGGALVDMQGRLIGINDAIYTHSGGYQGIGFAVPANMVRAVLQGQAGQDGNVIRPWSGIVSVQPVTREIAEAQGLDIPKGVLVQQVAPHSPAEKSGIEVGDIILSLGPDAINDAQSLNFRVTTTGIGVPIDVVIWRKNAQMTLPITFVAPPADAGLQSVVTLKGDHPLNGISVAPLTPQIAEELHLHSDEPRVVVVRAAGTEGVGINLQAGDIIIGVNGKEVHTIAELKKLLSVPAPRFEISVVRGGMVLTMAVSR